MIKIMILLLIYFKIVFAISIFYFILVYSHYKNNLNIKGYYVKDSNVYRTIYIKPVIVNESNSYDNIIELLSYKIQNDAFNILYKRIKYGKLYFLKEFNIKDIFIRIIFILLGISRLLLKISFFLIKMKNYESVQNFLYDLSQNPYDDRILIKVNDIWYYNGKSTETAIQTIVNLSLDYGITNINKQNIKNKLFKVSSYLSDVNKEDHKNIMVEFKNKNKPTVFHFGSFITNNDDNIGYATDKYKSTLKNNYDKEILISEFMGPKKISTELLLEKQEFTIVKELRNSHLYREKIGLLKSEPEGDFSPYLSKNFITSAKEISKVNLMIKEIFLNYGIIDENLLNDLSHKSTLIMLWSEEMNDNDLIYSIRQLSHDITK